ncbi:MAG: hypothetical protein BYD32DRAFT_461214 [Podila humilis]|nr:MAG: hypothetical protein BYD32DRAFT_461214 [Podila humilis]
MEGPQVRGNGFARSHYRKWTLFMRASCMAANDHILLYVLDSSSQQLRTADQQLTSLLQELQKAPAHASTSFVHDLGLTGQTTKPIAEVPLSSARTPPYQHRSRTPSPMLSPPECPRLQETTSDNESQVKLSSSALMPLVLLEGPGRRYLSMMERHGNLMLLVEQRTCRRHTLVN